MGRTCLGIFSLRDRQRQEIAQHRLNRAGELPSRRLAAREGLLAQS
jgi:hypothetical protein